MRFSAGLLCLILFSVECFAQKQGQELLDSLVKQLPVTKNDTAKARLYKRLGEEYTFIDSEKALGYAKTGLVHVTRMNWQRGIGVFNSLIARSYSDKGDLDSCLYYYKKSLLIHRNGNDVANIASTLINMGVAEQNLASNFPAALKYYLEGMAEAERVGDKYYLALSNDNIAQIYLVQQNLKKALSHAQKALEFRKQLIDTPTINVKRELAVSMSSLAGIYTEMKDTVSAMAHYRKAMALHEAAGNKEGMAIALSTLSALFGTNYQTKIENGLKAEKLWNEVNPLHIEAGHNLGHLGMAYLDTYRDALKKGMKADKAFLLGKSDYYLKKAIAVSNQNGDINYKSYFTGVLAEMQEQKGDFKNAYYNFRKYQQIQDSIFSQDNKNKISELAGQREIALRDKEIEISKLEIESQGRQRLALLGGLALLSVIGVLLYRQSRTRKRTNIQLLQLNSELDEANQVKARFFAILSHDLRSPVSNLVNFLHLQKEAPDLLSPLATRAHQERIADSAETLLETMESMLLWSKSQMQQFKPQARKIAVSELFVYLDKFFAGTQRVSFSFSNPDEISVSTDEDYLKTIMQNLTANAIKALKETPAAHIRWEAREEAGLAVLSIADNGPGATADQLDALYNDQVTIGIKTGLGLHLIRDLAKAISCTISVTSHPGGGTVFRLSFPA